VERRSTLDNSPGHFPGTPAVLTRFSRTECPGKLSGRGGAYLHAGLQVGISAVHVSLALAFFATFRAFRLPRPWAPAGMGRGALAPPWKCLSVFAANVV